MKKLGHGSVSGYGYNVDRNECLNRDLPSPNIYLWDTKHKETGQKAYLLVAQRGCVSEDLFGIYELTQAEFSWIQLSGVDKWKELL